MFRGRLIDGHQKGKKRISGVDFGGEAEVIAENENTIVLKFPAHTFNPGSRHSGLKSYSSPQIIVFKKEESIAVDEKEVPKAIWVECIISWDVTRAKKTGGAK